MRTFTLTLFDACHDQRVENVVSFVGEDASGSFGIQPGHARFMTTLVFGLARFRCQGQDWCYLAMPGAVLCFYKNELTVSARRFLIDTDLDRITLLLDQQLIAEEENLQATRESLRQMEQTMMKHMLSLKRRLSWM